VLWVTLSLLQSTPMPLCGDSKVPAGR
jgi:hypothetical protein